MTTTTPSPTRAGLAAALLLALAWPLVAQVPPPTPPSPQQAPARDTSVAATGTAVLAGMVVADDESRRPVRRAIVGVRGRGGSARPSSRQIMTDAEGRFVVADLPAGTYSVRVGKPGWVNSYYGGRESWKGPGTPVALGDGERRADLEVRLAPGAVITGRIYDQFGQAQAGARVLALVRRRYGGQETFSPALQSSATVSQTTDDRGEFRIFGLPPGEFVIGATMTTAVRSTMTLTTPEEVRWAEEANRAGIMGAGAPPPPGPAVGYSPVFYPGVTDVTAASVVTVGVGEERTGVDFQLQFVPTATIRGTATMPDGRPAQGLTLLMATSGVRIPQLTGSTNRATVGRDGGFVFRSVAPGDYLIAARASSQPPAARGRGSGPGRQPVMDLWAGTNVTVNGRDIEGLQIQMQPGITLSGRLAFSGERLEPPGNLQSVSLRLTPVGVEGAAVGDAPVQASADGTFEISGVAPGRYVLSAMVPRAGGRGSSGVGWLAHRAVIGGRNALDLPFEVTPGRDIGGVVVELTDRPAELSGQVTDGNGRPVFGLMMLLFLAEPESWAVTVNARSRRSPLDADGRYRMAWLTPGDYYLAALAEPDQADLADPAFLEQVAASAIRITLALGEEKVQDIRLGGG